jgi:hypothetical protein
MFFAFLKEEGVANAAAPLFLAMKSREELVTPPSKHTVPQLRILFRKKTRSVRSG